jgi:hypothetical protein
MVRSLGYNLPSALGSEQVASLRFEIDEETLADIDEVFNEDDAPAKGLANLLRAAYDNSLSEQFGGEWYAGRRPISVKDALSFIEGQQDLVDQHMSIVGRVLALTQDSDERNQLLEKDRYNFAAALDARLHGQQVFDVGAAGDAARADGKDYDPDCPPGQLSVAAQASQLGIGNPENLNCVRCPLPNCGKIVDAKRTKEGGILCPACGREARGGTIIEPHEKVKKVGRHIVSRVINKEQAEPKNKHQQSRKLRPGDQTVANGKKVTLKRKVVIGGTQDYFVASKQK